MEKKLSDTEINIINRHLDKIILSYFNYKKIDKLYFFYLSNRCKF